MCSENREMSCWQWRQRIKISIRAAQRWLKFGHVKNRVYYDGHEREDVVEYRIEFTKKFLCLFSRMRHYGAEDMGIMILSEETQEPEVVLVYHDETTFYAEDAGSRAWFGLIKKKGQGETVMVSGFICCCHGCLSEVQCTVHAM